MVAEILRCWPELFVSVSVTTRPRRADERSGEHYHYVDRATFARMIESGELLEYAEYAGNFYGTPAAPVHQALAAGRSTLLEIEVQGARQVRALMPDALLVFLKPPSWEELEHRLRGRATEPDEGIERRLATARIELAAEDEFDQTVVNTSVADAAEALASLMKAP